MLLPHCDNPKCAWSGRNDGRKDRDINEVAGELIGLSKGHEGRKRERGLLV